MIGAKHGLRTPTEEIAFTERPKIHSYSQIFRYGRSIFCLPHQPNFIHNNYFFRFYSLKLLRYFGSIVEYLCIDTKRGQKQKMDSLTYTLPVVSSNRGKKGPWIFSPPPSPKPALPRTCEVMHHSLHHPPKLFPQPFSQSAKFFWLLSSYNEAASVLSLIMAFNFKTRKEKD